MGQGLILETFKQRASDEKLPLLDALWAETTDEVQGTPLSAEECRFLDARVRDAEAHTDEERGWAEIRDGLLKKS